MIVLAETDSNTKTATKEEVDLALDKIFTNITSALREEEPIKITLDRVDETLNILFDAINRVKYDGRKTKVPDFRRILKGEH